jgi:molecular chaperone DnaK (HSP70)
VGYRLGVDLGTTFTAAAVVREGRAEMASIGDRGAAVPSVIWIDDEQLLTGVAAQRRGASDPGGIAKEFKRRLGDPAPLLLDGMPFSAEQLSAKLLRWVYDEVTRLQGEEPELVAVCHPANWGPYKHELLEQAIRIAEVEPAVTLTEPQAAAIHYAANEKMATGEIIAVYDLGGGTFDAAILQKTDASFEIMGEPEGIERLGGVDFDAAIYGWVVDHLDGALDDPPLDAADWIAAISRLRDECTLAKEALSSDTETTIQAWLPTGLEEVRLTRDDFERMIKMPLQESVKSMRRALETAGLTPSQMSAILLVGGSSRIPLVGQLVAKEFARPVAVDAHPKHAIALGAAMHAAAQADGFKTEEIEARVTPGRIDDEELLAQEAEAADRENERMQLLEDTTALAMEAGRTDLAERLHERAGQGDRQGVRVLIVGDYKAGKSSLVNALVGEEVCPVDADQATIVPTMIRYSEDPVGRVYVQPPGADQPEAHEVPLVQLSSHITETATRDDGVVRSCEIGVPSPLLRDGITIIDMPGAGGLDSNFGAQALVELASADVVIFVSSAAQELTQPELDLLGAAREAVDRVVYALTKVDYYPEWRKIRELDTAHLLKAELDVPIHPVSSVLVELARRLDDNTFLAESGVTDLTRQLSQQADDVRRNATTILATEVRSALGQLQSVTLAEMQGLDPAQSARVVKELEAALARTEDLRMESSEWHRVLRDGTEDLRTVTKEDSERLVAAILAQADDLIGASDPAETWEELQAWLQRQASWMVTTMFETLSEQGAELRRQVAERLAENESDLLDSSHSDSPWVGALKLDTFAPDLDDDGRGLTVLSASWSFTEPMVAIGQVIPFMSTVGLAVAAVGALTFGRKAFISRKAKHMAAKREHAHEQCTLYLEDAAKLATKELDKAITHLYRFVRDHGYERAEELLQSLDDALEGARRQAARAEADREEQQALLDGRNAEVLALIDRAEALAGKELVSA